MTSGITEATGITAVPGAFASSISPANGTSARMLFQGGIAILLPPSGFFANNGVYVLGQAPSNSATVSFSATTGAGVTMTFSAATLLGTASDVGRVLTVLDTTYKYATITAQSSTTVATVTITGTLSGTGPFANASIWLSGTPLTNTTTFSVPISTAGVQPNVAYSNCFMYFPANVISASTPAGFYYTQAANLASGTVFTVFNNLLAGPPNSTQVPAAPTAFATTGTGAFSQTTGSFVSTATLGILPANTMGPNGMMEMYYLQCANNNANVKNTSMLLGAQSLGGVGISTNNFITCYKATLNRGVTNKQIGLAGNGLANQNSTPGTSQDTTTDLPITLQLETLTAATDWIGVETMFFRVFPG